MSKHPLVMLRALPDELESLAELALDARWTWDHTSDKLWTMLDRDTWEQTRNPRSVLQCVPHERLDQAAHDPVFRQELLQVVAARANYMATTGWGHERYPSQALKTIAYFSMEFGLGEALPVYAGGLGILAETSSRPPAISTCRWSASACSIKKAISVKFWMSAAGKSKPFPTTILSACRCNRSC